VPNLHFNAEDFAASFLVSKKRLVSLENKIASIGNKSFEDTCFYVVRSKCGTCHTVMSRDYLDFMVEHLSSTSNNIDHPNILLYQTLIWKLRSSTRQLREKSRLSSSAENATLVEMTLGVIVFSTSALNANDNLENIQSLIRHYFLEATFWSIYRYFPNIVIFVGSSNDSQIVKDLKLPCLAVIDLRQEGYISATDRRPNLPKYALLRLISLLQTDDAYRSFRYVFHTEADNILHLRSMSAIFDAMEIMQGNLIIVPHRMQTLAHAKAFHNDLQGSWNTDSPMSDRSISLVTENINESRGSCCDDGRFVFADCNTWWYKCKEYGLQNHRVWLRFGYSGFTMVK
jgi:hypothetical protein